MPAPRPHGTPSHPPPYKPHHKVRFITATSLFDGHDATINIMRRILQATGVEVIHLGHDRAVNEIVTAALQEDVQGIAVTSYQGGHVEFFTYMVDLLRQGGGENIRVFGGGGGVITPEEINGLHAHGVRIFTPEDGHSMGLQGMINEVVQLADFDPTSFAPQDPEVILSSLAGGDRQLLARVITGLENGVYSETVRTRIREAADSKPIPVLGITGTGGAGKSSLTDELVLRFRLDQEDRLKLAIISIDPSRKRTGGALLGDRIRMNAIAHDNIYMRSMATRETGSEISLALPEVIAACKLTGFDLIMVETSGIGQGNAAIVPHVDQSLYVMTPEFGAASQLEKIDMLDFAHFVAINKFDRNGAEDALRDVRKQYQRNHNAFATSPEQMPVYPTIAARFNDPGVTALFQAMLPALSNLGLKLMPGRLPRGAARATSLHRAIVPAERSRYLAEIAATIRGYHARTDEQVRRAREYQALGIARSLLRSCGSPVADLEALIAVKERELDPHTTRLLEDWPELAQQYGGDEHVVTIRDREQRTKLTRTTLSGLIIRKVCLPRYEDDGRPYG
jgi:methylmalonyl-CoA mutase